MRIKSLALIIVGGALGLTACGGDDDTTSTSATVEATALAATDAPASEAPSTEAPAETPVDTMADTVDPADPGAQGEGTIVDVAASNEDFSTLVAALQAAGLDETLASEGAFTVFAPTNEAFEAALNDLDMTADDLLADTELLTKVLTYHVVSGEVPSSEVVELSGEEVETVNGAPVTITVDGDAVMVNDANVVAADVEASNGVIHGIDKVLLPPAGEMTDGEMTDGEMTDGEMTDAADGNLMMVANADPDLSIFVASTGPSDLFKTLAVDGTFTIFAPTNEAFEAALNDLDMTAEELFADTELLTKVLTYHVVEGAVPAADVVGLDGQDVTTVEGSAVQVTVDGDTVMVNDATVVEADKMATNGVIHVIDKVLLPPAS